MAPPMTASDREVIAFTHSGVNESLHVPVAVRLLVAPGNTACRLKFMKKKAQAPMSVLLARFNSSGAPRK